MIKLLILFLLIGCNNGISKEEKSKYDFTSIERINGKYYYDLVRYENNEIICYSLYGYDAGGLSCKFKDTSEAQK